MTQDTLEAVGVDISKAHLDMHELPSGRSKRFPNDAAGFQALAVFIARQVLAQPSFAKGRSHLSTTPTHRCLASHSSDHHP